MAELDLAQGIVSDMNNTVDVFTVEPQATDGVSETGVTRHSNEKFTQYYAYYKTRPEFKNALNAFATWVLGKGIQIKDMDKATIESIRGMGEDTFTGILWNLIVTKKMNGDAYAEIIRDKETNQLINLKPLDPASMTTLIDERGIIIGYEQTSKIKGSKPVKFPINKIFHIMNDRIADNIHGTSITEAVEWVILAMNQAIDDQITVMHRNVVPARIIEADTQNPTKLAKIKSDYQRIMNKKDVMIYPKDSIKIIDSTAILQDIIPWIKYLENFFYQTLGVPKVILGGSSEFTEASSKIGYLTFEVIYIREVNELIADLWNQLAIRVTFKKPASLENELLNSEEKNTGQTGFQPNDTIAGRGE